MKNIHEMFVQWRKFLLSDKMLLEISDKTISQDYQSAKEFVSSFVRSDLSAFYCLNLLIENLASYTEYLEISAPSVESDMGFGLKQSFLYKREEELTDANVKSFIDFTIQCLEVLLSRNPELKPRYDKSIQDKIISKIDQGD
ncbi:MAG: hypothetical protein EBY39_13775 [Flavobacteriia bacterium]|nr:hypothetical protein [Flavobacteriia bacterium]